MGSEIPVDCLTKFKPLKLLGEGGFGRVYLAEQLGLGRQVAVKVLRSDAIQDEEQKKRFVEEGRITAQLSHPNVVRVIDAGAETGVPWLVYELVEGPSLRDKNHQQPLRWREAIAVAVQIASALEEAHSRSIVHRDVKAENVLEFSDGNYKLADFGIAKWSAETGVKTRTGFVIGTPTHLAPELIKGLQPSPASDVYALGVLLYELVTGRLPFPDENLGVLMRSHLERDAPTPTRLQPTLPVKLDEILKRALEKDPLERIASARELREALEHLQHTEDVALERAPSLRPLSRPGLQSSSRTMRTMATRAPLVSMAVPVEELLARRSMRLRAAAGVFVVGLAACVGVFAFRSRPVRVVDASPSATPATPQRISTEDEKKVWKMMGVIIQEYGKAHQIREASRAEQIHRQLFSEPGSYTVAVSKPLGEGLDACTELIKFLNHDRVRGCIWLYLGMLTEELFKVMKDDPRGYAGRLRGPIQDLDRAVQEGDDPGDIHRRAFLAILSAQRSFGEGQKGSSGRLAAAYAAGYEVLAAPASQDLFTDARRLSVRLKMAFQRWSHESHARDELKGPLEPGTSAPLLKAIQDILAVTREVRGRLDGPDGTWLASETAVMAVHAVDQTRPFLDKNRLTPAQVSLAAEDALAIAARFPGSSPLEVFANGLAELRTLIREHKLPVKVPAIPWEAAVGAKR